MSDSTIPDSTYVIFFSGERIGSTMFVEKHIKIAKINVISCIEHGRTIRYANPNIVIDPEGN